MTSIEDKKKGIIKSLGISKDMFHCCPMRSWCEAQVDVDQTKELEEAIDQALSKMAESVHSEYKDIFDWLEGRTNFRGSEEGEGAYWWRKELRQRLNKILPTPKKEEANE